MDARSGQSRLGGALPTPLNLRNPVELAESLAWPSAAFPGRHSPGVAHGYHEPDFSRCGL